MKDKCPIYAITINSPSPFVAGYDCRKAHAEGRTGSSWFIPYEPDTKDGEDFVQGMQKYDADNT